MCNGILIVEHPSFLHEGIFAPLASQATEVRRISWEQFSPAYLTSGAHRLVIANAVLAADKATKFFARLRQNPSPIPIFAIIPESDETVLQVAADAADDFLLWPARPEELRRRIMRFLGSKPQELADIQASLSAEMGLRQLVGEDPSFLKVLEQVVVSGTNDAPVLLTGETGTGKELCARAIHQMGKRRHGPFIPVDCGAIPDHLFENELFGHVRGAFTDARNDQKGLVALAEQGTLFMDEIDSLSSMAQSKVLRLLQEHTYRPLGSESFKHANLRIIAATNGDLEGLVAQKHFRSDLVFRINVLRIHLPALRDRRGDIQLLSRHFIEDICRASSMPKKVLSLAAVNRLERYDWPGNVRELYNVIQRAVLFSPGAQIPASAIDLNMLRDAGDIPDQDFRNAKLKAIEEFERTYVKQILGKHDGNVTRAAREAGKDRRALGRLAKKYGIGLQPSHL
jgi:DNA-binding NtrC family response regulator